MSPNLKKSGLLPAGVHLATWDELVERFGFNEHRLKLLEGLKKGLKALHKHNCYDIYIGGSFVTDKPEPGDVDVCFDNSFMKWKAFQNNYPEFSLNEKGFYNQFKKYKSNFYPYNSYDDYFFLFFQYSRNGEPKGLVKLSLKEVFNNDTKRKTI